VIARLSFVVVLAWLIAAFGGGAAAQAPAREALVVFGDDNFPPYESLIDGRAAGANVDLWNAIGQVLQRRIDIRLGPWSESQAEILRGAGDALSFVNITEERQRLYDFTQPTFTFRFPIFTRANDLPDFSVQNLSGKRLAVKRGGFPASILATSRPEATAVPVDSIVEAFRMLLRGEVDGVIESEWVGYDLLRSSRFTGIRGTADALAVRTAHIAVRKGDTVLVEELNQAIRTLTETGVLDAIADKWAGTDFVLWERRDFQRTALSVGAGVLGVIALLNLLYVLRIRRANRRLREEIAKRETAQNQLYQAQKMEAMGQLAGGIAHDFNNLIGAILGFANFIVEDTDPRSREHGYARRILTASRRARELIQQILAFSRTDPGTRQPTAVPTLLNDTVELLRATLPSSIALAIEIRCRDATVSGNPTQLIQVLINLAINAADARGGAPGRITLTVDRLLAADRVWDRLMTTPADRPDIPRSQRGNDGVTRIVIGAVNEAQENLVIGVHDDGPGIAPDVMARLFEPFFTTKPRGKGTGLGLPIVQRLVLAHGGALRVSSKPGAGASFEIVLPALAATLVDDNAPAPAAAASRIGKKGHVIVVDDDLDFGDMVSTALDRAGYETVVVNHPREALEAFDEEDCPWRVVVTDQTMPDISGLELINRLKARRPDLRCLLCTAYTSTGLGPQEALAAGADAFLRKPVEIAELLAVVARLFAAIPENAGRAAQSGSR
jgi:signal transduction histidine kinase/ActR/RegA family two-component response regulator